MPKNDDDDEIDSFVLIGTPLADLLPEDAKFSVKPKRPEEQIVTDEKGRQRFHGAFTGGFSAGYFNTVGSKEGWTPGSFKSSRGEKADRKNTHRPEDFMDEEDFNDHGIAPKGLQIKSDYRDQNKQKDTTLAPKHNTSEFVLDNLITPVQSTIGVRMLRKMGWREGQGIGPRIKRKLRNLKTKINFEPGRKIYGVALPSESEDDEENEELEDDYFVSTFDINDFQFQIKEDMFGLGYKRLDVSNLFGKKDTNPVIDESPAASLLFPMGAQTSKKKGITGQSFGVGEFEDDDDIDVYKQDNMEMYDFDLNSAHHKDTRKLLNKSYGFGAFDDDVQILKKFITSKKKLEPSKVFEAPKVPADFNLTHKFQRKSRFDEPATGVSQDDSVNSYLKSVSSRSELLGEIPIQPESVFDLMKASDREFLQKQKFKAQNPQTEVKTIESLKQVQINLEDEKLKKDKRYESYVQFIKKNYTDPYNFVDTSGMTEWDKQKEREDFENRYNESLKKIELLKKDSRFVSKATLNENNQEISIPSEDKPLEENKKEKVEISFSRHYDREEQTDLHKAALDKKYGSLTRIEYEWRPNPILCKRFNVPNPYKDAKEYGTIKSESDTKRNMPFSLFNVMTAGSRFDKSKTLFDEINEDVQLKEGPSNVKTITLIPKDSEEISTIEFEAKKIEGPQPKSDFFERTEKVEQLDISEPVAEPSQIQENVYLQERPDFDMFKAIFEDEEDDQNEPEEMNIEENNEGNTSEPEIIEEKNNKETTIVSSSIPKIDLGKVSRLLDDENEIQEINEVKPVPEALKFTLLVKSLAKKSTDSTSDSSSSSSEEIVYEEFSVSPSKKHKKKDKKKKKKHSKKKKSKKSHKNK